MEAKYLGKSIHHPVDDLDTFAAPPGAVVISMVSDELLCHCPITSQPDHYRIEIEYKPDKLCIESKSLKLYLWHFQEQAIFAEHLPLVIRDKIMTIVQPLWCKVTVVQKARGGITITVTADGS